MSLRGRLLAGLVSLVMIGMLVSDVVTYTALRRFLVDRIDQQLQETVVPAAQELSSQYSLAYSPANTRADGQFRKIVVRVAARPELKLRTRTGYTAALGRSAPVAFAPQR